MTSNQPNSRLDQIEAILLQTAQQQQVNTLAIANNRENIDALIVAVSGLVRDEEITKQSIQQLTENVNVVSQRVDLLAEQAAADRQIAAADRQIAATNHQVTLGEIQRIWQYLLDRNPGNGRTGE